MLLLEAGCIGVFLSLDLFLFFLFWEIVLVPMYFLIGGWGYERRVYATLKFFIYTMLGSALMLVGILALVFLSQKATGTSPSTWSAWPRASRWRRTPPAGCSWPSPPPSPSSAPSSRSTRGCPTPTPRRPPAGR